jgi:hypothetical protein
VGSDIAFAPGEYAPRTTSGRWLLAHELAHVVQQGGGRGRAAVQRDVLENVEDVLNPGALLGKQWLRLDKKTKLRFVDKAVDLALVAIDKFPGRVLMGGIWEFLEKGLIGFYAKLKTAGAEVKVNAVDKLVKILSSKDEAFTLAYLKGLAKGFFIDGALGIFIAVWDLIRGLGKLWEFFKGIADAIGGFPEEIETLLKSFAEEGQNLLAGVGPAIEQLRNLATNPKQTNALIATVIEKGKGLAKEAGAKIAESLLGFFSKPEASAEIGETVGGLTGQVLWEVAFAALTAGGGVAVTAAKTALREAAEVLGKLAGRVVSGVLKVVAEIRTVIGKAVDWMKGGLGVLKGKLSEVGEGTSKLFKKIVAFLERLLGKCHESKLVCDLGERALVALRKIDKSRRGAMKQLAGRVHGLHELEGQAVAVVEVRVNGTVRYAAATNSGAGFGEGWSAAQRKALGEVGIEAIEPHLSELVHAEANVEAWVASQRRAGKMVEVLRWGISAGRDGQYICGACRTIAARLGGLIEEFSTMGRTY